MTPHLATSHLYLRAELDRLEALTPPAELSEWHSQYVESISHGPGYS